MNVELPQTVSECLIMANAKLKVGLIGTGDFGPYFAPYVNEVAELVAVCDPNPAGLANFSKQTGLKCGDVATVRAMAAPQIDSGYDFPDTLHVSLGFKSGAVASLTVSLSSPPLKFRDEGGSIMALPLYPELG